MEWEVNLIEWIQNTLGSLNSTVGTALSFLGGEIGLLLVVLILMFCWKKEVGKRLALIVSAVNTWLPMLKAVVMRPRPYMEYPDRVQGVADYGSSASLDDVAAQGYSFPSTHSASTMALYIPLAHEVKKKRMRILAAAIPFLVGVSRAVTGMHYPTDILAGWALAEDALFDYRFADAGEAAELLLSNREYYENLSQNDLNYRLQKPDAALGELEAFAAARTLDYTDAEKAAIDALLKDGLAWREAA